MVYEASSPSEVYIHIYIYIYIYTYIYTYVSYVYILMQTLYTHLDLDLY